MVRITDYEGGLRPLFWFKPHLLCVEPYKLNTGPSTLQSIPLIATYKVTAAADTNTLMELVPTEASAFGWKDSITI